VTDEADDPLQPDLSGDSVTRLARRADSLLFSLAQTTDEITQAYRLVYKNYLRSEYIDPHPSEMRYTVFNALPKTATFIARLRDAVTTTASVIFDSPLGLPLEAIYHEEVDELRRNNARLCEVTMLADRRRADLAGSRREGAISIVNHSGITVCDVADGQKFFVFWTEILDPEDGSLRPPLTVGARVTFVPDGRMAGRVPLARCVIIKARAAA